MVANQQLGENNMYLKNLNEKLDQFHLLNHPFYIAWNNGELNQEILQDYLSICWAQFVAGFWH